jgi:aminopeptidase N
MLDSHTPNLAQPSAILRADYTPPDWLISQVSLNFDLAAESSRVGARLTIERNGAHDRPLVLNGDGLMPLAVRVDGQDAQWSMAGGDLVIAVSGPAHLVETEVALAPAANTKLMGLYASGGLLCSQCEAEGFRRITFFPDRPDILSRYQVKMTADKAAYPVLLSNGNCVARGDLDDGRHWAEWHDPSPKPCYLFAIVGRLGQAS